jgi:hypothetical protein
MNYLQKKFIFNNYCVLFITFVKFRLIQTFISKGNIMKLKMFMFLLSTIGLFFEVSASPFSPDGQRRCVDGGENWPCRRSGFRSSTFYV